MSNQPTNSPLSNADAFEKWLAPHRQPGETLESWALLGYASPQDVNRTPLDSYLGGRGLDPSLQRLPAQVHLFVVLTNQRLMFASKKGLFKASPHKVVDELASHTYRVEWADYQRPVANQRLLVFVVDDGSWIRASAMVHHRQNVEHFISALGSRAVPVAMS